MNALEDAVKHIEYSADNESDRQWAREARAELAAQTAVIEAVRNAEFVEATGECLLGCGGDAATGHKDGCEFIPVAAALAALDKVTK